METKILVTESNGFSKRAEELLRQVGTLILADLERESLLKDIKKIDVLWVRLRHHIDAEVMDSASCLKIIVTPTTGLNHIDVRGAKQRGIQVISLQGKTEFLQNVRATAEHTVTLMLALLRNVPSASNHVQQGGWNRDFFRGHELHEKTVGIVGYGRLGRIVGRYLQAFGASILAFDPHVKPREVEQGVRWVALEELLLKADIVTLHVSLDDTTFQFFGWRQFTSMKSGAWFVNTARGELVDESALLESLKSGHMAGAAVDVLGGEQSGGMSHHPLVVYAISHSNLIITPHIGGCTIESMEKTELFLAEELCRLLAHS